MTILDNEEIINRSNAMETTSKGLTPEKVVRILKKHGTIVSLEEAAIIIDYINKIARIAVSQYLREV